MGDHGNISSASPSSDTHTHTGVRGKGCVNKTVMCTPDWGNEEDNTAAITLSSVMRSRLENKLRLLQQSDSRCSAGKKKSNIILYPCDA